MNIDIGGGTSKIAVCEAGEIADLTAVDVGARVVSFDAEGRVARIEEAGWRFAAEVGLVLEMGGKPDAKGLHAMVERMADRLFEAISRPALVAGTAALLRLAPLRGGRKPGVGRLSGGGL